MHQSATILYHLYKYILYSTRVATVDRPSNYFIVLDINKFLKIVAFYGPIATVQYKEPKMATLYQHGLVVLSLVCLWSQANGFINPLPAFRASSDCASHLASTTSVFADVGSTESPETNTSDEKKAAITRERFTLFVGNIPFDTTSAELTDLFALHGKVELVSIPNSKETGMTRGFAFVDMASEEDAQMAIAKLHESEFKGRTMRVNKSLPKEEAKKQPKRTGEFSYPCNFLRLES
jgi:cold-inducible RNA-binding protein